MRWSVGTRALQSGLALLVSASAMAGLGIESRAYAHGKASDRNADPLLMLEVFPVHGSCWFADTWGDPRGTDASGRPLVHEGTDIIAPKGTPLVAAVPGRITRMLSGKRGGNQLWLTARDGSYLFYGHIDSYAAESRVGRTVKAGDVLAYVGKTGATSVNHLHFEIHPSGGAAVNPYPKLRAISTCRS